MKAELVPIDSISLDPANLRRHPTRNLAAIVESLKRFGQQRPILVDAAGIVRAGNGTLMAAKQLGYKCYGMEISPAYCDVIVKRWETLTDKKARLG